MKKHLLLSALLLLFFGAIYAQVPTVTTAQVSNIQQTTAMGGGTVTNAGGGTVTERGICWSTSHNPTTNGSHASNGTGPGSFTVNMTGLTPGTTYYVRAYATNSAGTAYGSEVSFTTVPQNYTINVSADPTNGGTVSGGGTFPADTTIIVTATPSTGFSFVQWTENGYPVSTNTNYSFTVTRNCNLVAQFQAQPQQYTVTVSADPTNGGSVSGSGTYEAGESCTVSATANNGYVFTNWTENGNVVSTSANYTFTVNGNRTLVAHFIRTYTINVSANPSNGGTVSGGGTYQQGQSCTVSATVYNGYVFTNWTENGNVVSTNANYTFTVNGNRTLVAHFQAQTFNITASADPTNGGNVSGGGTYNYGATCTLTATPASGFNFINWTKDGVQVSTNQTFSFTVTSGGTYIAHFSSQNYIITAIADPSEGGTVSGGGGFNYGDQCTLRATANTGYTFVNWTKNGEQVSTNPTFTFNVTESATYVAHFQAQSQQYTITVSANPSNGGTVSGGGTYAAGQSCTVSATANTGYVFINWRENGTVVSTSANYTFNVTSNRNLVAHFIRTYTINVSANPTNGGTVSGGGTYQQGQSCTVSATANNGYVFTNWTENGNVVSTNANYTFTVNGNRTLVANFQQQTQQYTITVSANPTNGGTVSGGGTYAAGQSCTVSATANNGYVFTNWTENGNVVSTSANYTFTVNGNRTLVAHFNRLYTITVSANPTDGGTVSGGGSYQQGQSCTVVATAADGYTFSNWTENGNVVNTNANYTFVVNGNRTLVANFTLLPPDTYNINVSANPSDGGTVTGGGTYSEGESCTVSATANEGFAFDNWTENGNVVNEDPSYTFTVTGNRTLVANFQANSYTITVKPDPQEGGTVSGGGTYQQGQSCTVNAVANSGYAFINWTEDGNQVSVDPSYTFTVTGDRILVAHFEEQQQQYTITTNVTPTNSGTVTGGGTYYSGDTCTLNAIPAQGYQFEQWKTNGQHVSNEPTYSFVVTGNATYTAYFRQTSGTYYTITLLANPEEGGTVTGGDTYLEGTLCTVHATANPGYLFVNWTENGQVASEQANYTFTVNANRTLEANFVQEQPEQYVITVNEPTEGGTVTVDQNEATPGTIITITVNADDGYELETLSVYKTNDPSQQVTVTNNQFSMPSYDVTVMANFTQETPTQYTINTIAEPEEGGIVEGDGQYYSGTTCTLHVSANEGYYFVKWTKDGSDISDLPDYSFVVTENATYKAHFFQGPGGYTISVRANPEEGGNVTGSGTYAQDIPITVTATANEGYKFTNWTENGVIQCLTDQYEFDVNRNRVLVANFEQLPVFTISATAGPNANIDPQGDVQVVKGSDATFTIRPDFGFFISEVLVDGNNIGQVDTYTFANVDSDHTISVSVKGYDVEEHNTTKIKVYPNPAKEKIFVEGDGLSLVSLYDLLGNCLSSMNGENNNEMSLAGITKGVYVLMIETKDNRIRYQKLIVAY